MKERTEVVTYDYETKPLRSKAYQKQDRERSIRKTKINLLDRIFPGVDILSWSSSAVKLWCWLAWNRIEGAETAGLMPNIVVDRTHFPHQRSADGRLSFMNGENLWQFASVGGVDENGRPNMVMINKHSIVVYQRSYNRIIKDYWKGRAPRLVHQTIMAQILIHEMFHYITLSSKWAAQFADDANFGEAYDRYVDHITNAMGTADDEFANESITNNALRRLLLSGVYTSNDAANILLPKVGGPYDQMKRSMDPIYKKRMDAFEVVTTIISGYYFDDGRDQIERAFDIIEEQHRQAVEENYHVTIVD